MISEGLHGQIVVGLYKRIERQRVERRVVSGTNFKTDILLK